MDRWGPGQYYSSLCNIYVVWLVSEYNNIKFKLLLPAERILSNLQKYCLLLGEKYIHLRLTNIQIQQTTLVYLYFIVQIWCVKLAFSGHFGGLLSVKD